MGLSITVLGWCAAGQAPPVKESAEAKGIPARTAPTDYQAHSTAGTVTIAAEFLGHSVPTQQGTFTTEDYVVVEAALYGPPGGHVRISFEDFSLRINGKKKPSPGQPFGMVFQSLKDPEWEPPKQEEKPKTSFGSGGGGNNGGDSTPAPVHMPLPLQRAMEQKVQKTALPEGDRGLPQAGLIFFPYRGKPEGIHSLELIYSGAAGQTTFELQP